METLIDTKQAFKRYKPLCVYYHPAKEIYYHARIILDMGTVFDRYDKAGRLVGHSVIDHSSDSMQLTYVTDGPKELFEKMKLEQSVESMRQDLKRIHKTIDALKDRKDDLTNMLIDMEGHLETIKATKDS